MVLADRDATVGADAGAVCVGEPRQTRSMAEIRERLHGKQSRRGRAVVWVLLDAGGVTSGVV